jgi:hypothetical protein
MEAANCFIREVNMLPYQTVRWDDLLGALKAPGEDVRQWLKDGRLCGELDRGVVLFHM